MTNNNLSSTAELLWSEAKLLRGEIFEHFDFLNIIEKLAKVNLLYKVAKRFAITELHPNNFNNCGLGWCLMN